ncbi:hypothetical protein OJAV_G00136750 [Oryzias javanicus]|uniref:Uncharacterized protein n=1 Tax=Oryzias javanicus TaxID=123683 RepID=A0A3S2P040_ORYJA|nr:hypothetical protein OJAV_G00136750 [Oryzias javanicus]
MVKAALTSEEAEGKPVWITAHLCAGARQVEAFSADFTTRRTQLLCLGPQLSDDRSGFSSEFSAELEANINTVLCADCSASVAGRGPGS